MEFINIHVSAIDSPEFQGATPTQQATWLKLLRFLCGQESGDRIVNAKQWSERTWLKTCDVTPREVNRGCGLWKWDSDDLVVAFYPHDQEEKVKNKRKFGLVGAEARWKKPLATAIQIPMREPLATAMGNETKPNQTEPNHTGEPPRVVSLDMVMAYLKDSGYSGEQIKKTFLAYDEMRNRETGDWQRPTGKFGGMVLISDWRSAMTRALSREDERQFGAEPEKNAAAKKPGVKGDISAL